MSEALDELLDRLDLGGAVPVDVVRAGLADLVDRVGEATVRVLELLDGGGTIAGAMADDAVRDLLELCGLAPTPWAAGPVAGVPVTIGSRPRPRCDVCENDRGADHAHVADVEDRRLLCVCDACRLLLEGSHDGRLRGIPDARPTHLVAAATTPGWWEALDIPVGFAFLVHREGAEEVAVLYPSPAGVAETTRPVSALPAHLMPLPDVEALVVLAEGGGLDAWRAPVTVAYEMSGRLRHEASLGDPMATVRQLVAELG